MPLPPRPLSGERPPLRLTLMPIGSVAAGSLLGMLPLVADAPLLPPLGLLMLLGWRLLRPALWEPWVALPLGLFDDLVGGAPLGSAMAAWTIVLLALDLADHRLVWRDYLADWGLAALALTFVCIVQWATALFTGGAGPMWTAIAQALLSILLFPLAARICRALDRWRLRQGAIRSR